MKILTHPTCYQRFLLQVEKIHSKTRAGTEFKKRRRRRRKRGKNLMAKKICLLYNYILKAVLRFGRLYYSFPPSPLNYKLRRTLQNSNSKQMKALALIQFKCVQAARNSETGDSFHETNRQRLHNLTRSSGLSRSQIQPAVLFSHLYF